MASPATPSKAALLEQTATLHRLAAALPDDSPIDPEALTALHAAASSLAAHTAPPLATALKLMTEPVRSMAVRVGIDCGWFEALVAAEDGALSAETLAQGSGVERALLVRLMRVLSAAGVVDEVEVELYAANTVTGVFCIAGMRDGAKVWFDTWAPVLLTLPSHLAHFGYREPRDFATCAFPFANGVSVWKYFEQRPARRADFDSYMTAHRAGRGRWVDVYPVGERLMSGFSSGESESTDTVMLVDVGGGWGHDVVDFAKSGKAAAGRLVLQDLAEGLPPSGSEMRKELEELRVQVMVHDFFTPQPVKGARAYSFRSILHDWPDEECRRILQNTIPAMKKGYSRILINDMVIPNEGAAPWQGWLDMVVMAGAAAKERSQRDWEELLDSVGLRIVNVYPMGEESVIEVEMKE